MLHNNNVELPIPNIMFKNYMSELFIKRLLVSNTESGTWNVDP